MTKFLVTGAFTGCFVDGLRRPGSGLELIDVYDGQPHHSGHVNRPGDQRLGAGCGDFGAGLQNAFLYGGGR